MGRTQGTSGRRGKGERKVSREGRGHTAPPCGQHQRGPKASGRASAFCCRGRGPAFFPLWDGQLCFLLLHRASCSNRSDAEPGP